MIPLLLCLLATLPIGQGQDGPDGPDDQDGPDGPDDYEEESPDDGGDDDGGDCTDVFSNCGTIAENNWCEEKHYVGKCCASCKAAEEAKDPDCHDTASGCVYYKDDMCKPDRSPDECKKTCGKC